MYSTTTIGRLLAPLLFFPGGISLSAASAELSLGWESAYVSEGRRILNEPGGLCSAVLTAAEGPWFVELWNGWNASAEFWELDATLGGSLEWDHWEFSSGYTLVKVWVGGDEDKPDHEWFWGATRPLSAALDLRVDFVWGHLSGGSYIECGLEHALPAPNGLDWSLLAAVAWDFGYASGSFDGLSHAHFGTTLMLPWGKAWSGAISCVATVPFEDLQQDEDSVTVDIGIAVSRRF